MKNIALTKTTDENRIARYFDKILSLNASGKEFPVDLDDIWPLVYHRKDKAVRALQEIAVENIDFQCLRQNGGSNVVKTQTLTNAGGDRRSKKYKLTVACMEWFIARKVRPVFEVYRKVFHEVIGSNKYPYYRKVQKNGKIKMIGVRPIGTEEQHDIDQLAIVRALCPNIKHEKVASEKYCMIIRAQNIAAEIYDEKQRKRAFSHIAYARVGMPHHI